MRVLVLDTIHGGSVIASALRTQGHTVDCVDVYRGEEGIDQDTAFSRQYSCCIAPVHLDPAHPLLHAGHTIITHHQAVGILIGSDPPHPMIEITGARGKTTTALALASLMRGPGILHTSSGTSVYPEQRISGRSGITPASLLEPAQKARSINGWFIGECSLGVSGRGDLGILTSAGDYTIARNKKSALAAKLEHLKTCRTLLLPDGIQRKDHPDQHTVSDIAVCNGTTMTYDYNGTCGSFDNPLLSLQGYREPLLTATAAACLLSIDPFPLGSFEALPGRMRSSTKDGCLIVDASNSGTTRHTTIEAARYARQMWPGALLHLVIGQDEHAVCENFPMSEIEHAILEVQPDWLTVVSRDHNPDLLCRHPGSFAASSLDEAVHSSDKKPDTILLLAVKTWR